MELFLTSIGRGLGQNCQICRAQKFMLCEGSFGHSTKGEGYNWRLKTMKTKVITTTRYNLFQNLHSFRVYQEFFWVHSRRNGKRNCGRVHFASWAIRCVECNSCRVLLERETRSQYRQKRYADKLGRDTKLAVE